MPTPTADKLKAYYPGKALAADDDPLTVGAATSAGTVTTIIDTSLTQADDYWNGAIGYWLESSPTAALRNTLFHVKDFDAASDTLTTYKDLPAAPAIGDDFVLILGGNYRSDTEALGLAAGGVFPELANIAGTNVTGVDLIYCSPQLGEGTLNIDYLNGTTELRIKMDAEAFGVSHVVTGDVSGQVLFAADGESYVIVDIVQASLPGSDQNDNHTLTAKDGTLTPDYEGEETNNVNKGKTRYRLEVVKNTDGADAMTALKVYSNKPDGTNSDIDTGESLGLADGDVAVVDASDWPERGFWVKNNTLDDCRYVNYRSGNRLYCFGVDWAILTFDAGVLSANQNDAIDSLTSGGSAIIDQQVVQSGSFGGSDAVGYYLLKNVTGDFFNNDTLQVSAVTVSTASANKVDGLRGKTAQAWAATETLSVMTDVDIAIEAPTADQFSDPATETETPDLTFVDAGVVADALSIGNLAFGDIYGVWRREYILDDTKPRADVNSDTNYEWT